MIPSYMFYQLNSFSVGGWVKQVFAKTYEPLNSKFGGTPLPVAPTQNRVCLAPPNHTFILPPIYKVRVYYNFKNSLIIHEQITQS